MYSWIKVIEHSASKETWPKTVIWGNLICENVIKMPPDISYVTVKINIKWVARLFRVFTRLHYCCITMLYDSSHWRTCFVCVWPSCRSSSPTWRSSMASSTNWCSTSGLAGYTNRRRSRGSSGATRSCSWTCCFLSLSTRSCLWTLTR